LEKATFGSKVDTAEQEDDFMNQGTHATFDPLTHTLYEDIFYDPLECAPFYKDSSAPIWYSRIEDLKPQNQNIVIFGFVTSASAGSEPNKDFEIEYKVHMRGKDHDESKWTEYETEKQSI